MISEWFPEQEISLRRAAPVASDTYGVRTHYVSVNIALSVNEEIVQKARRRAEAIGKSVNQLVREYLERLAGAADRNADADEFERLSQKSRGNSRGRKFNHEGLHRR